MGTYAIIYGTTSKMIRRVIADDDGQVSIGTMPDGITPAVICKHPNAASGFFPLAAGETAIVAITSGTAAGVGAPAQWAAQVLARTGVTPPVIVCALIDQTHTVVSVIHADPAVDLAPGGLTMVQCYAPSITVGCTYDPIAGLFTSLGGTIPPHTPGNATNLPIAVLPALIPKP